jgi:hypothetical protein
MREIKFRGKTEEMNSWWTFGNLVICDNGDYQIGHCTKYGDTYYRNKVFKETVGQYTGLKDKNGKEIYEGDIVYIKGETEILDIKGKVEYSETFAQYIITNTKNIMYEAEPLGDYENIEVIGNIYDNTELLAEKEK